MCRKRRKVLLDIFQRKTSEKCFISTPLQVLQYKVLKEEKNSVISQPYSVLQRSLKGAAEKKASQKSQVAKRTKEEKTRFIHQHHSQSENRARTHLVIVVGGNSIQLTTVSQFCRQTPSLRSRRASWDLLECLLLLLLSLLEPDLINGKQDGIGTNRKDITADAVLGAYV